MKFYLVCVWGLLSLVTMESIAAELKAVEVGDIISKEEFSLYKDVGEFIDQSPKVTVTVQPDINDIAEYGKGVTKTLTGSDCNRDGKMDDNHTCNAVFYKLWLKYKR